MSRDLTVMPYDYIVHFVKNVDVWTMLRKDGDYACDIDVQYIPLVRCKDCKYWPGRGDDDLDNEDYWAECRWREDELPNADDFCSYGEREGE